MRTHRDESTRGWSSAVRVSALLSLLALSACRVQPTVIDGRARDVVYPTLRTEFDLRPRSESSDFLLHLDAAVWGVDDDFIAEQPGFQEAEFQYLSAQVAARLGTQFHLGGFAEGGSTLTVEGLVGLEYSRLDMDFGPAGGPRSRETDDTVGPMFGLRLSYAPIDRLRIYARGWINRTLEDVASEGTEVGMRVLISDEVYFLAGYRWWNYENEQLYFSGLSRVELDLDTRGFVLGMGLSF